MGTSNQGRPDLKPGASARSVATNHEQNDRPPDYGDVVNASSGSYRQEKRRPEAAEAGPILVEDDDSSSEVGSILTDDFEDDEDDWALDEAASQAQQAGLPSYEESETMQANETVDDLVQDVITSRPAARAPILEKKAPVTRPLPCPVIIPQRRPRDNAHGFVRAYAPVLDQCGIDEQTFLRFLKSFHKTIHVSPVFPAVEIGASIAGMDPPAVAMAVTIAVSTSAGMGPEVPTGYQVNDFLDRMNESLFQPAGLYAMIAKYKPDGEIQRTLQARPGALTGLLRADHANFSISPESMPRFNRPEDAKAGQDITQGMSGMRLSEGAGRGPVQYPHTAPLVFPALDRMLSSGLPGFVGGIVGNSLLGAGNVVSEYVERRSQLNIPSRRSLRQKHATSTRTQSAEVPSLVSWATNGAYNPRQNIRDRRVERHLQRDARRLERGRGLKHERRRERQYGEAYFDELERRTEEKRHEAPRQAPDSQRRDGYGRERGLLAGSLVAGLLSVAANTVAEATGSASYRQDNYHRAPAMDQRESSRIQDVERQTRPRDYENEVSDDEKGVENHRETGTVKRVMREDVLYLMIVNMPTEVEMSQAWEELEKDGRV